MNYKLKCKLYIYLSIVIVILTILYIFIHTLVMKGIFNFNNIIQKESSDLLNKKNQSINQDLTVKSDVQLETEIQNKKSEIVVIKLKDFSITMDSLFNKKVKNEIVHQPKKIWFEEEKVLDQEQKLELTKPINLEKPLSLSKNELNVQNTIDAFEKFELSLPKELPSSLEKLKESNFIVAEHVSDDASPSMDDTTQNEVENFIFDASALMNNIKQEDQIEKNIETENLEHITELVTVETIMTPESIFENNQNFHDIENIDYLSNMLTLGTSELFQDSSPFCEEKEAIINQGIIIVENINNQLVDENFSSTETLKEETQNLDLLIAGKVEALEKTLAVDNGIEPSKPRLITNADLVDRDLISPSSVKKIYSMQAVDKSINFQKIVSTYQKVSELYK
jgi:hypothetical protein